MMIERYRTWFQQERYANEKMLVMINSVPEDRQSDPRFARVLTLAAHIVICRENWLDHMAGSSKNQVDWWPQEVSKQSLSARFAEAEAKWTSYLESLSDADLPRDFVFVETDGSRYRFSIEGQIVQLVGHAFYHRGQIALLVDQLGGETVDTDYVEWEYHRNPSQFDV